MSGSPRDGESSWLRFDADQPNAAQVDADTAQDAATDPTTDSSAGDSATHAGTDPGNGSAWLRHDLPDAASTDVADSGEAGATPHPDSPWLPSEVQVARPTPTPEGARDTGVPPTMVVEAEDSTPAHRASATRPLPDEAVAAASASAGMHAEEGSGAAEDQQEVVADQGVGRRGADDQESVGGLAVLGAAIKEFAIVVGMALVLSFIVKTWLLQAFYIPSGSMEDTLVLNDRVIVSKLTPGPIDLKRGDIVVFADPGQWLDPAPKAEQGPVATVVTETLMFVGLLPDNAENHLIKRVIGLPGDHVVCCDEGGRITINGTAIKEPYLKPGDAASEQDFDVTVPRGRVWVMGDHRSNSADSRVHDGPENNGSQGSVDERLIVGRAVALVWPLDHLTWLATPTATFAQVPATSPAGATDPPGTGVTGDEGDGPGGGEVGGADTPTGSG